MNYLVIIGLASIIPVFLIGSSILDDHERYALILDNEKPHYDLYLEFFEIDSKNNRQVIIDEGVFVLNNEEFQIIDHWKGSFLNDDKLFFMAGNAESFDKEIQVFLMGKFIQKTIEGSLYDISIHIHSETHLEFQAKAEIIGIIPKQTSKAVEPNDMPPKEDTELLFLIKDSHHRFQNQEYVYTTKLYDKKQNSLEEWNVKGGEISNAEINVKIVDLNGNILREKKGSTNEFGWFEGKFPLGVMFPRGEYLVLYAAKYQDNIIEKQKPLYVFEIKTDADYRHFLPTSDISKGQWNDNTGNQNELMFDDLDEFNAHLGPYASIDNTDYVHSKNLGKKDSFDSDTFLVRITTNGGVTQDHEHILSYVFGKDEIGGSNINLTVTLSDGANEIAAWEHVDIEEGFQLVKNTLTREQVRKISNYGNLNLNFTAWCDPCMGGADKRDAQVSWIHMIA